MQLTEFFECGLAILKERSPSCGSGQVYDGTFSKTLTEGDGIFAALLKKAGIPVISESQIETCFPLKKKNELSEKAPIHRIPGAFSTVFGNFHAEIRTENLHPGPKRTG